MKNLLLGGLCLLALPASVRAEPSRDQAVLDAILRVESRYLDQDRRDPNLTTERVGEANTVRKARHLDKLLSMENLSKDTVLAAYKEAQDRIKQNADSKKPARDVDRARYEAFRDLLRELRLTPPTIQ